MILDTSALIAIALEESDANRLYGILASDAIFRISAGNLLELHLVLDRRQNPRARHLLTTLMDQVALIVEPVTESQVIIAREAARRYGKGCGHPARLNYGDCFAYALAKERDEPLLFIGNDFSQTDIIAAL